MYRVRFDRAEVWGGPGAGAETEVETGTGGNPDSIDVEIYESWLQVAPLAPEPATVSVVGAIATSACAAGSSVDTCTPEHGHAHTHDHAHSHGHIHTDAHYHGHTHDHGHTHEERHVVEQDACDREVEDTLGKYIAEILVKECVNRGVVTQLELTASLEKVDMLGTKSEGPRIVARAWCDSDFKRRLLTDANTALTELGIAGSNSTATTKLVALENTLDIHNVIVCTLCSCYPLSILGLSPPWYKSRAYRARLVRSPRLVLQEFGTVLHAQVQVQVHDSTADCRYIVIPTRPVGTENWTELELQAIVTRDSMIGVRQILL